MNIPLLFAFWGVVFALIVVPGPDWAYTVGAGLRDRSVIPAVSGIVIGYLVLTAIVAGGVGTVVAHYPVVLTVVTIVGAAYLLYLGIALVVAHGRSGGASSGGMTVGAAASMGDMSAADRSASADVAASPVSGRSTTLRVARGVGVSVLNPKGVLLFVALLPQFASRSAAWPLPVQLAVLGALFAGTCAIFYTVLGVSARTIIGTRPRVERAISRFSGVAMIVIAIALLVEQVVQLGPAGD